MGDPANGWRTGRDPVQRWLRVATALVCLGVFVYVALDAGRGLDAVPVAGLALGAVMILVGYERLIRLPGIGRDDDGRGEK